jgi:hypothetical protein
MYLIKSTKTRKAYVPAEKFATISVLNSSTVVTDDEIKTAIPDFQAALDEDFSRFWAASYCLFQKVKCHPLALGGLQ